MEQSDKGLPTETRQKLGQVAHLNKAIRLKEEEGCNAEDLRVEREELISEIQAEIEENDKNK